ncbi:hypothetical protein TL16_g07261, partial [Triparma laevis f. inornata]
LADPNKIKFGYLKMLVGDDDEEGVWKEDWKRFYFVLLPGHMYAYERSRDSHPSGHLGTSKIGVERSPDSPNILHITTPLRSFQIKFRDSFELFDWLHSLMSSSTTSNCGSLLKIMHSELNGILSYIMREKLPIIPEDLLIKLHLLNDIDMSQKKDKESIFKIKPNDSTIIGRESSCHIQFEDPNISRAHAKIDVNESGGCKIADLNSGNGTRVNGDFIKPHAALTCGDVVVVGKGTVFSVGREVDEGRVKEAVERRKREIDEKPKRSEMV